VTEKLQDEIMTKTEITKVASIW